MTDRAPEPNPDAVRDALRLMRNVEPAALAAGLMTLAQIMVEIREGTNVLPPKSMDALAIVDSVLKGSPIQARH